MEKFNPLSRVHGIILDLMINKELAGEDTSVGGYPHLARAKDALSKIRVNGDTFDTSDLEKIKSCINDAISSEKSAKTKSQLCEINRALQEMI